MRAVKAAGLRIPADATPEARALADRCQQRIIDVMEERVYFLQAPGVLKAASGLREEICGPVPKRHELTGKDGEALTINVVTYEGDT